MGWLCPAPTKRIVAGSLRTRFLADVPGTADTVIVDVNAAFRSRYSYCKNEFTPLSATSLFLKQIRALYPGTRRFVFCFDDAALVPDARHVFYKEKRYRPASSSPGKNQVLHTDGRIYDINDIPAPDDSEISPTWCPYSGKYLWSRVWSNPVLKEKLWLTIAFCLVELLSSEEDVDFVVDGPTSVRQGTFVDANGWTNWGEADAKALHWAFSTEQFGSVCIETIDWDMFIQLLLLGTRNIRCRIGTVFTGPDKECYSLVSARKTGVKMARTHEFLHASLLNLTLTQRIHAAFWCLLLGGVDYCDGISDKKTCLAAIQKRSYLGDAFFQLVPGEQREFLIDRDAISKKVDVPDDELKRLVYCLLYYLSWNSDCRPAGPRMSEIRLDRNLEVS